jgi:hypothetical protein
MNASEFFNSVVLHNFGSSSSYGDWTSSYWELEFVLAEVNDCNYSVLDDYATTQERTCDLCGTIHDTNEYGSINFCENETCNEVRRFFGFTSGKRPIMAAGKVGSDRHKRVTWLRRKLTELYGTENSYLSRVYGHDLDCRLSMLISLQIVREQIEHQRITRTTGAAIDFDASEPEQRKLETDKAIA